MARIVEKGASRTAGLPPGTAVHVGKAREAPVRIRVLDYDPSELREIEPEPVEEYFAFRETATVTWINVDGIHDVELVEKLGKEYGLHPLVVEDIVSTEQRPKTEVYEKCVFMVVKMFHYDEKAGEVVVEQLSLVLGSGFVLSFQEREGDVFDPVRERIRKGKGRIRHMGADYLFYALLDAIVDGYFGVLERFEEKIDRVEESLAGDPRPSVLKEIHDTKRGMIFLRKSVWPLREAIASLHRGESSLISAETAVYIRDVHDHTIQVIDTIESFRDIVTGMQDTYLSSVSNRMNEVMKVLTIIATIFIPLTFIAGVYGMNFKFMPELDWRWSYPVVWLVMAAVVVWMVVYFRRKRWL